MLAVFYMFNKRKNSLKTPTTADISISGEVLLKQSTSIHEPVFIMAVGKDDMPKALESNYCAWNNTYYWVEDIIINTNNHIEFTCREDVLATYKNEIMLTKAFVNYDTTPNSEIPDGRLSRKTTEVISSSGAPFPYPISDTGVYVLTAAGKENTCSYVIDNGRLVSILNNITNWTDNLLELYPDPEDVSNIGEVLKWNTDVVATFFKQLVSSGDAIQNIKSCIWLPLAIGGTGDFKNIWLGNFDTGVNGYSITSLVKTSTVSVNIPWQFGDWRRRSPYTEIYLYIPFIGEIHYSADNLIGISSLTISFSINLVSGAMAVLVSAGKTVLGMYNANIACQIPVGTTVTNPMTAANNMITIAGGVASGLIGSKMKGVGKAVSITMGIEQAAQGTLQLANTLIPNPTTVGGNAGGAGYGLKSDITCVCITHGSTVEPDSVTEVIGTPSMEVKLLGSLTGYVETDNVSVSASATQHELDEVNALLDGGVYIE